MKIIDTMDHQLEWTHLAMDGLKEEVNKLIKLSQLLNQSLDIAIDGLVKISDPIAIETLKRIKEVSMSRPSE